MSASLISDLLSLSHSSGGSYASMRKTAEQLKIRFESGTEFIFFSLGFLLRVDCFENFVVYNNTVEPGIFHHAIIYTFIVLPVIYMQLVIGQYTQLGPIHFKYINPLTHGLGYIFILTCMLETIKCSLSLNDNVLYFLMSMQRDLQWMLCRKTFEEDCLGIKEIKNCDHCIIDNKPELSAHLYWRYIYMKNVDLNKRDISFRMPPVARIILLGLLWGGIFTILIYFGKQLKKVFKKIRIIRTNVIIITTFMLILLAVALLNKGSSSILVLIFALTVPQMVSWKMWMRALIKNVESLSLGKALYILMGNFLPASSTTSVLAVGISMAAFFQSFLATLLMEIAMGLITFGVDVNTDNVQNVIRNNYSLPNLIIIPEGFGLLAAPQLWSVIYFFTNILMLFNNQFVYITVIEKSLTDSHPKLLRYRRYMLGLICITFYLISVPALSKDFFTLICMIADIHHDMEYLSVCLMTVCVSYIYGVQKLSDDIHFYSGSQPAIFWKVSWYVIPVILPMSYTEVLEDNTYRYGFGFVHTMVYLLIIAPLPISIIKEFYEHLKCHNLVGLFKPSERWGPADPEERHLRKIFNPREEIRSRRRYETCQHNCLYSSKVYKKVIVEEEKLRNEFFAAEMSTITTK